MSQDKPATKKAGNPRVRKPVKPNEVNPVSNTASAAPQPNCHIHDDVNTLDVDEVRQNLCAYGGKVTEFEGKHYCLFHLPSKDKNAKELQKKIDERVEAVRKKIVETGKVPEALPRRPTKEIFYDFRYVWFLLCDFWGYEFLADVNFDSATFADYSFFNGATFKGEAVFRSATFMTYIDFRLATFAAHTNFSSATFSVGVDFSSADFQFYATFWSANFAGDVYFNDATFKSGASFNAAEFSKDVHFVNAKLSENIKTDFNKVIFKKDVFFDCTQFNYDVHFDSAIFEKTSNVFFKDTVFVKRASFQYCTSEGYLCFGTLQLNDESRLDFQEAAFEKAVRVSFHTCQLRPHWFINVDSRKFVFTNVDWGTSIEKGDGNKNIKKELEGLGNGRENITLLNIACRQLAVNAEDNNRYDEAAKFRYLAMETRRLESIGWRQYLNLHWFYKWSSGYGENWRRAAGTLFGILIFFCLFYAAPVARFETGANPPKSAETAVGKVCDRLRFSSNAGTMTVCDAVVYSLGVATFQRPEPKPADVLTKFLVTLETILAPLQAALLALAIRRKFMR